MSEIKNRAFMVWLSKILRYSAAGTNDIDHEKHTSKIPAIMGYIFLSIPMYIFFFCWLRIAYSIIMILILSLGLFFACKSAPKIDISYLTKSNGCKIAAAVILAAVWVYLSGIGKLAFQNYDHMWRNAILEKLVNENWPVVIEDTHGYFQQPVAFIYYFAIWLPAALFGKIFGLEAAHIFLFVWCTIGILLVFLILTGIRKKLSLLMLAAFVLFSGLDAVGDFILNNTPDHLWFATNHLENWAWGFQMSSFSTQLFWVFNQAIPAWLLTALFLIQKDNRSLVFIYSLSFMSCTLPAIGMIPVIACIGICRIVKIFKKKNGIPTSIKMVLAEVLTVQNIITGLSVTLISFLFLKANTTGNSGFRFNEMGKLFMSYLIFALLEFGVYFIAMNRTQKKVPLYWVSLGTLMIVPLIAFGPHVDFVMRASIPSLIVMFVLIFDTIDKSKEGRSRYVSYILTALLLLGGINAYHEIARSVTTTIKHITDPNVAIEADKIDLLEDGNRGNFFGEFQDSFFFKYLSR